MFYCKWTNNDNIPCEQFLGIMYFEFFIRRTNVLEQNPARIISVEIKFFLGSIREKIFIFI